MPYLLLPVFFLSAYVCKICGDPYNPLSLILIAMWLLLVNLPGRDNFRVGESLLSVPSKYPSPWKQWWLSRLRSSPLYFSLTHKSSNLQQVVFRDGETEAWQL